MGRGYLFGLLYGALASVASLAVISLMAPPATAPAPDVAALEPASEPEPAPAGLAAPEATAEPAPVVEAAPESPAVAAVPEAADAAPEPMSQPEPQNDPMQAEPVSTPVESDVADTAAEGESDVPETPVVEVPAGSEFARPKPEEDPVLPGTEPAPAEAETPVVAAPQEEPVLALTDRSSAGIPEGQSAAPTALGIPEPILVASVADAPAPEAAIPVPPPGEAVTPQLDPAVTEEAPVVLRAGRIDEQSSAGDVQPSEAAETELAQAESGSGAFKPAPSFGADAARQPVFGEGATGVTVNRPTTTEDPATEPQSEEAAADPAETEITLAAFAAPFFNPDKKPLLAVVLLDRGPASGGLEPAALATLGMKVTIAIDPTLPDASRRAELYRLAGHEVAILAPELPSGATASDLEVSYQSQVQALPEAVALIGETDAAFQNDRDVAEHLAALLADEGRGLITYDRGLNPARQAAVTANLPHVEVYRALDAQGESAAVIERSLDRAGFEASRTGAVTIVASTAPETLEALKTWIEAGAKGSAVAPVSAIMLGGK
ncbi:divergent polysaccharide deacetylase family protein [Defluviimonas sp. CAU 1641]|uniref:Divergent polysaccharide deacetylase family protein n=2 Tax=Defluviimonas salinarum TaxID=2992147 RepID=A0ABT3IXU1_9RHOB|nr:divergent polysaccharide deacetylase family protein [Defluviimonas salinarum]